MSALQVGEMRAQEVKNLFMFLTYLDDSGTGDKDKPFQLMTAVLVPDAAFSNTEIFATASLAAFIPPEQQETFWGKFEEFKAWQLFGEYGPFEGIKQDVRFRIIDYLLKIVARNNFPVIFGAVNKAELKKQVYASVSLLDMCFRSCLKGIISFMEQNASQQLALLIADDSTQEKKLLRVAFLDHRERMKPILGEQKLIPLHDDMYFGDSKYSIGIQMADLCGYFIAKHIQGHHPEAEGFYEIIKDQIMYSRIEPEGKIVHPAR